MLPQGYRLCHLPSTTSTMDEARHLALQGEPSGALVLADRQLNGRGRLGRVWHSPQQNFYLSILQTIDPRERSLELGFLVGVAIVKAFKDLYPQRVFQLKWPNDVVLNNKKVGGTLLEVLRTPQRSFCIIGVGLNLTTFPPSTNFPATSLRHEGLEVSKLDFLAIFIKHFEALRKRWRTHGFEEILTLWRRAVWSFGQPLTLTLPDRSAHQGIFVNVTSEGHMVIRKQDHTSLIITAGDVGLLEEISF